jgi:hypothetical protein
MYVYVSLYTYISIHLYLYIMVCMHVCVCMYVYVCSTKLFPISPFHMGVSNHRDRATAKVNASLFISLFPCTPLRQSYGKACPCAISLSQCDNTPPTTSIFKTHVFRLLLSVYLSIYLSLYACVRASVSLYVLHT